MSKIKKFATQMLFVLCIMCVTGSALAGTLSLPAGLTVIEEEAFEGTALTTVFIPETTERIESRAFADSSITDIYLPAKDIQIESDAFDLDSGLTFHVFMGSASANWAIDHKAGHNYKIEYMTGDGSDFSASGWGRVGNLVASESTDPASNNPYYTKRLIVRLKSGHELPDLSCFNCKEIVPLDKNRYVIQFNDSQDAHDCDIALQAWGGCQNIEKDFFLSSNEVSNTTLRSRSSSINSTDPMGFNAYTAHLGDVVGHVTIAVIDSGINVSQVGSVVSTCYDLATNSERPSGYESHGTNVTNQIVNAFGPLATPKHLTIIGYNVKVNGEYSYLLMVRAIDMAHAAGADFINISIAGASQLVGEQDNMELYWAIHDYGKGKIFAAAGNHSNSASNYLPGKYCTPIGAVQFNTDGFLRRADQTCTGATYSGYANNTSYATAMVTAAKALVYLDPDHPSFPLWGDILENGAPMPKLDILAVTPVSEIVLNNGEQIESILEIGDRASIDYEVIPDNATVSTVTVTSSDSNIVEVLSNTGVRVRILAKAKGTVNLTFTADDGNVEPIVVPITVVKPVTSVTVTGDTGETLMKGETLPLIATVLPADATDTSVTWTSSNDNIATVSETGVVTQVGSGEVTITATSNYDLRISDSVTLNVSDIPDVTGVTVTAPKSTIGIGVSAETMQMTATVSPANADQTVTWSVDRPDVATISETGLLTAVSDGEVIVTATSVSSGKNGYMGITVIQLPTSVTVSGADTVNVGELMQLTATVSPDSARDKTIIWSSSRTAVATVDANTGLVTGVSEGTAVIIAKCKADSTVMDYYAISVTVLPDSITIDTPSSNTLDIDETLALSATVSPSNASNKAVTWSTNDSAIATVSSSGVVTAKAPGSVQITASTVNGKTDSITLTVRQPYTLSFNANGGSCSTSSWTCYSGSPIGGTLPTASRTGHTFAGWYTAASGGSQVTTATSFTSSSTVTIYAHWTANPYTVTFNANGGSAPSPASKSVTYGSTYGTLATSSKTGYGFAGWFTSASGGLEIISSTTVAITSAQTLYAHWTPSTYTVSYNANGGSVSPASKTVTYDSTYGSLATPTRTGYTFAGWFTAASGGTQITTSTKVTITSAQTLYAHWTPNTYTVSYNANGGSVSPASKSVTYDSTYGTLATPTRTGYRFDGWFTATSGGTQITASTKVTIASTQTIYAHWTANDYTYSIVYKSSNGTSLGTSSITKTFGTTNTVTPPAKTGYTTPAAQSIAWDATSKTITFTYGIASVSNATTTGTFTTSPSITYTTETKYQNRTATSVDVCVTWALTIHGKGSTTMQNAIHFWGTCGSVSIPNTKITSYNEWKGPYGAGVNKTKSATSSWVTVPLTTTDQTTLTLTMELWQCNANGTKLTGNTHKTGLQLTVNIPAY